MKSIEENKNKGHRKSEKNKLWDENGGLLWTNTSHSVCATNFLQGNKNKLIYKKPKCMK